MSLTDFTFNTSIGAFKTSAIWKKLTFWQSGYPPQY